MNELEFLNLETTEQKIVNFYSLHNIQIEYVKKVESFSVDRYFYNMKKGKISSINNLLNELQLFIEVDKIKLSCENSKGYIIFECSKADRKPLYFEDLKNNIRSGLTASIGKNLNNEEIQLDLLECPHLLVAGSTGSGKSCLLNNIITSLILKYDKNYFKTILVDIKQVEFLQFQNISQLASPIITTTEKAIDILNKLILIMNSRYSLLSQNDCRNIEDFNKKSNDKLCYYLIVIDELADLFIQAPKIEELLCRLLQLGRAAGIHLILATQRPDCQTISNKLKINIPTRIALTVTNSVDSRIILDTKGAEKLTGKGDFILKKSNGDLIRGQSALIKNLHKILNFGGLKNE